MLRAAPKSQKYYGKQSVTVCLLEAKERCEEKFAGHKNSQLNAKILR
jgi:hypothetical protein